MADNLTSLLTVLKALPLIAAVATQRRPLHEWPFSSRRSSEQMRRDSGLPRGTWGNRESTRAVRIAETKKGPKALSLRPRPKPGSMFGAGNETRTRDPDLGKVVLYQLSYSRVTTCCPFGRNRTLTPNFHQPRRSQVVEFGAGNETRTRDPDLARSCSTN